MYETDYRFSNSEAFQSIGIASSILDPLLEFAFSEFSHSKKTVLGGSEDKLISALAITFGVLRGLSFESELINSCLREIDGVSLDQALDWVRTSDDLIMDPPANDSKAFLAESGG